MITDQLFADAYTKGLRSTIRLLTSKGMVIEEAEEVAQAAWAKGWEARAQIREPEHILSWIKTIAINRMYAMIRRAKPCEELSDQHAYEADFIGASIDARTLIKQCSRLDRSLIYHHYAAGRSMDEIAKIHGINCGRVRVRLHRARVALRQFASKTNSSLAA